MIKNMLNIIGKLKKYDTFGGEIRVTSKPKREPDSDVEHIKPKSADLKNLNYGNTKNLQMFYIITRRLSK